MRFILLNLSLFLLFACLKAQPGSKMRGDIRVMFWNTENFYDVFRDSLIDDKEFLPNGPRYWTSKRYNTKLLHAYKTIVALGGWEPPEIIGLCEIENRRVLRDLLYNTPLGKFQYGIVHKDSPDKRGIDVAMLYRKECFIPLDSRWIRIRFPDQPEETTRDIMYVKGVMKVMKVAGVAGLKKMADGIQANQGSDTLSLSDTIHIFLNHWPSRSAGQMATENRRMWVAQTLRLQIDSLLMKYPTAKIVIAGDFNDEPHDISLTRGLGACAETSSNDTCHLVNLSAQYQGAGKRGTHKYQGEWSVLDQLIISNTLLHSMHGLHCNSADAHIFDEDFLLLDDENGLGKRPFRTYDGYRYAGGFSDHLAIYLDLWIRPSSSPSPH